MTRNEEIKEQSTKYMWNQRKSHFEGYDIEYAFRAGAQWADQHPNAINFAYLQNWYQDSIDETREPIWTDKHLEELFNDFYLIPKDAVIKK